MASFVILFILIISLISSPDTLAFRLSPQSKGQLLKRPTAAMTPALNMIADTVLIDPSYDLAAGAAVVGTICGVLEDRKGPLAKVFGAGALLFVAFGAFIAFQTTTLRFQYDSTSFSLVKADGSTSGENAVVGGENKWDYKTFKNWAFLPSEKFPILVYFKETQTPVDVRQEVPIKVDDADGQVHFFPAIANTEQLKEQFIVHNCPKI
jgi:Protein of unknown function (DUF3119)